MTRYARIGPQKQAYHAASTWKELNRGNEQHNNHHNHNAIYKDKRRETRRIKRMRHREANRVCFHCRMPGHGMADCPTLKDDTEQGVNICFKCGSTEHSSNVCTAKVVSGKEFMYAKCFVCGETGHLSRSCPDNPRGLYPEGGCCPLCESVEHFKKDCPQRKVKHEVTVYRLTSCGHTSIDDEASLYEDVQLPPKPIEKKHKVVKF